MSIALFVEALETSVQKFKKADDKDLAAAYRRKLLTMLLGDYSNDDGEFSEPTFSRLAISIDANMNEFKNDWDWLLEIGLIEEIYPKSYLLNLAVLESASFAPQGGK